MIHKGQNYEIHLDGATAVKRGCGTERRMTYYAERDTRSIAGELDEADAWRLLADIAPKADADGFTVCPEHILIDGEGFAASEWSASLNPLFTAPEGYSASWSLGATVFYLVLGCHVFQGLGGEGQTATAPVPWLRREMPELSALVARCLSFEPADRPTLAEIAAIAKERAASCIHAGPRMQQEDTITATVDRLDELWPEKF